MIFTRGNMVFAGFLYHKEGGDRMAGKIEEMRKSGISAQKMTQAALTLMEKIGGRDALNCVAETDETALMQAKKLDNEGDHSLPLFGIPVLIKDNIDVKGLHTTAGSLALSDNLADTDAPVVRNLRKNGAIIVGKTNMTEFANYTTVGMPGGYSSRGGQVIHAVNPEVNPSGSSSGSGVAVSAGIVPVAVGTDTSFSITACAQANGICGIKPPIGMLPSTGIIPIAHTLDSAGPMAGCIRDALELYSAMRDEPLEPVEAAKKLKIAVNIANIDMVSAGQMEFARETLRRVGAEISEIDQPRNPEIGTIMKWEFGAHLEEYLRTSNAKRKTLAEIVAYYEANPDTMLRYGDVLLRESLDEVPGRLSGEPYRNALNVRAETIRRVRREIEGYDAVLMTGFNNIMHFCGLPSVTVAGSAKNEHGVNRALILYGADEMRLYRAALALEKAARGE